MTSKSCGENFLDSSVSEGISSLQYSHHVAQKFRNTSVDFRSCRETFLPSAVLKSPTILTWIRLFSGIHFSCAEEVEVQANRPKTMTWANDLRFILRCTQGQNRRA